MLQIYFNNNSGLWQYFIGWSLFAVLQASTMLFLTNLPVSIVFADSFVQSALFAVIGLLLWGVVRFGNFNALTLFQRSINYIALAVLSIGLSIGGVYGFEFLLGGEVQTVLIPFLPLKAFILLLVYISLVQYFHYNQKTEEIEEKDVNELIENNSFEDTTIAVEASTDNEVLERIAVKSGQKIHVILVPEIVYIQADGDYVHIYTMTGKYLKEQTMKYFSEHLPVNLFVRVHRSCLVNVEAISRIELYEKQNQQLTLKNGHQIKVSQAGYKLLRQKLKL